MVDDEPDFSAIMNGNFNPESSANISPTSGPQAQKKIDVNLDISAQTSNLERRLRMLEERYGLMQKREQMVEQNMLSANKKINTEIKAITEEIAEIRQEIAQIKEKVEVIIQELKQSARREEIKVIEKYLELWDPSRFATQTDVENIVRRMLSKNSESFKKE
ncbi:MAG: hypothetical protein QXW00_00430 [Candidatus Woesearchaeota archaeon]